MEGKKMSENTEKMTLKELEKQFQEMRERYEEKIKALDIGHSGIVDHFDPNWIKFLHNWKF